MTPVGGRSPRSYAGQLARLGLDADRVVPWLRGAGLWTDEGPTEDAQRILALASEVADPEDALLCMVTMAEEQPETLAFVQSEPDLLKRVLAVAGTSRPLGELLARHRDAVDSLANLGPTIVEDVSAHVTDVITSTQDFEERAAGIASVRRRSTADIAARDLTGVIGVEEVATELAALAEGVLRGTVNGLHAEHTDGNGGPRARLAVIGMGKLGGRELNYISDVDVIFVHAPIEEGDEDAARIEATQVFEGLLRLLNASTTMGRVYEIDPTLRPEGREGPLSRTVESYTSYWERWAKTWEFQALIKARPVAGDLALASQLLHAAAPFVWPDELEPAVIGEIREMKAKVEKKPEVVRHGERQIKLGPGGLRDIEFAVQLLQLVHGRVDLNLRLPGTLPALGALAHGGYVAEEDANTFVRAYRQLRTVEHRLQLAKERRTHTVPEDESRQEWLARSMGYRADGERPARVAFMEDLRATQAEVRGLHTKLFYRPLLELHAAVPVADAALAMPVAHASMGEEAARERLAALGFRDAGAALRNVRDLTSGLSRRAKTMRAILPAALQVLSTTPAPDPGLRLLARLLEVHGGNAELLARLRDDPPTTELLARLMGTSSVVGEMLINAPAEVITLIAHGGSRDVETLTAAALGQLGWQDSLEAQVLSLRRFKRRELIHIAVRYLDQRASLHLVSEELTALGDACLVAALAAVAKRELDRMELDEPPARIAIIGMGKLGGRELHFCSDLDVMFVHDPVEGAPSDLAAKYALRVAEHTIKALGEVTPEGTAFEVDAELRPEGRGGPLSRSLAAFRTYYERRSDPWEHQALVRARAVAGNADLGAAFMDMVRPIAFPDPMSQSAITYIRKLKARMERERVPDRSDVRRHIKLGPGGLSDIEWTIQLLQQIHGSGHQVVRTAGTMAALDGLEDEGLIGSRDAAWLRDAYHFLSTVRNHLTLAGQHNVDEMPIEADLLQRLAHALGYGPMGRQAFEDDHRRHTRHVRQVTERIFYGQQRSTWGST